MSQSGTTRSARAAADGADAVERLVAALAESARSRNDRRLFFGRGQQDYAAWMLGVCLAARDDLGLGAPGIERLPARILALVFGDVAGRLLAEAIRRQAAAYGERIAEGRATYAAWDGRTRLAFSGASAGQTPAGAGRKGSDAATSAVGGTIPGPTE